MKKRIESIFDNEFIFLWLLYSIVLFSLFAKLLLFNVLLSTVLILYSILKIKKFNSMQNWVKCESLLISCQTLKKFDPPRAWGYIYIPDCLYTYTYNDKEYKGKNISLYPRDSMIQDLNEHHQLMQKIKRTINKGVYVNPNNHEESVVFRDMAFKSAPIYWGGIVLSTISIVIGFIQISFF